MTVEATVPPADTHDIHWVASWGDKLRVGDLVKVQKMGGPVLVHALRKFEHNHPRPALADDGDDGHWYYGAVVTDKEGREFHLFIQPTEPCFIGMQTPTNTGETEGLASDGDIG